MRTFDWTRLFVRPLKVYTQLGFWLVVFLLFIFLKEYPGRMRGMTLICLVFQETLELAIPSYTQNLLVLPFFKARKWLLGSGLYLFQVVVLIRGLPYLLNAVGLLFPIRDRVEWRNEHITFSVIAFTVIATIFKLGLDRLILEKQQKEDQLRHLKAQLNPHFLFNTLNNLYGLSVAESKTLPGLMLKLSELLRYSLYDTSQHYVAVQKELDYISNYVELERIRLSDKTDIQLRVAGDFADRYMDKKLTKVYFEEINYVEAYGNYIFIFAGRERIMSKQTLTQFEQQLPAAKFARIHKSYIVSLRAIKYLEGNEVLAGEKRLPVGKVYKEQLLAALGR